MELVPIKIKILLDPVTGDNLYPRFNDIPDQIRKGMDWSKYVMVYGLALHYDRKSGFHQEDVYNADSCCQYMMTCVPEDFAEEAVKMFPDTVSIVDEATFEMFYDRRAHDHEVTEKLDPDLHTILARIQLERDPDAETVPLTAQMKEERRKCLDPNCQENPGIRKNLHKTWELFKTTRTIKIRKKEAKP